MRGIFNSTFTFEEHLRPCQTCDKTFAQKTFYSRALAAEYFCKKAPAPLFTDLFPMHPFSTPYVVSLHHSTLLESHKIFFTDAFFGVN